MAAPTFTVTNHAAPAQYAAAVTPSDTTDLAKQARFLFIGTGGNLVVDLIDGTTVTFTNVKSGYFWCRVVRVRATNTTATNIVAMW